MDAIEWVNSQLKNERTVYAIVDPRDNSLPMVSYAKCNGSNAMPLLSSDLFKNAQECGPWILSITAKDITWLGDALDVSFTIACNLPFKITREHFSSLFEANLAGDTIIFPFYKPRFIIPMLERMNEAERILFLNGHDLGLQHENQWVTYLTENKDEIKPIQISPWWKVESHHVSKQENIPLITANLMSWLWQRFPDAMDGHLNKGCQFESIIMPFLDTPNQTLTYRVMSAAARIILPNNKLTADNIVQSINDNKNEEVAYGLFVLANQIKHGDLHGSI